MKIKLIIILFCGLYLNYASANEFCPKGAKVRNLESKYEEMIRLHDMYVKSGMGLEAADLRQRAALIIDELPYAYLDQEIAVFPITKKPDCMFAVLSQISGTKTLVQPRTDGKWNIFINDVKTKEGLDDNELLLYVLRRVGRVR